jgi:methyl-accepting chemotaxis protein
MNLQDLKISTRLTLGFGVMSLLIALLGAVALIKVGNVGDEFTDVAENFVPKIEQLNTVKGEVNNIARASRNLLLMSDPADLKAQYEEIAASNKAITDTFDKLQASITSEAGKAKLAELLAARAAYVAPRDRMIVQVRSGKADEARATLLKDVRPVQLAYMEQLDELIKFQGALMDDAAKEVQAAVSSTRTTVIALVGAAIALAFALAVWIIRSTTRPLNQAVEIARAVAQGDLAMEFRADGRNETGLLLAALHDMKTRLAAIVGNVRGGAEGVAAASAQIAQGNSDLSSRTEEQASALEETAASMEQLSSTVRQNADNAKQANQLAAGASTVAVKGGEVVNQVVDTMKSINESSRKIADIIGVIDGIAFQTNILALNAAVEAARAGEQGRGFAVVAGEVRNLAQRSAEAAKEIKSLISTSVERVEQGTQLVDQAGTTMTEVVTSIRRVTDIMGEISAASTEQSAGVAQVGEAVGQMDQATQQNAALVEESAAAAESLKSQAQQLVSAVAVFKLAAGGQVLSAPPAAPKAPAPAKAKAAAAPAPAAPAAPAAKSWNGAERRGPDRAKNVARLPAKPAHPPVETAAAPRSNGTDDWESF